MDYFNDLFAMFLSLDRVRILAVYERVREHQKYINLCSEDEDEQKPDVFQVWNDTRCVIKFLGELSL